MLFSEEWLRHYINPDLSTEELAESLTMAGLEVEEVFEHCTGIYRCGRCQSARMC